MTIAIINYGASNLYSVKNCLNKLNLKSIITSDDEVIRHSSAAILPGVGAFGQAMYNIKKLKLDYSIYRLCKMGLYCFTYIEGIRKICNKAKNKSHKWPCF